VRKLRKNTVSETTKYIDHRTFSLILHYNQNLNKHCTLRKIIETGPCYYEQHLVHQTRIDTFNIFSRSYKQVQDASVFASNTKLQDFASTIIRLNRCLEGGSVTKAIEILRSLQTPNILFASAESGSLVANWQSTQGCKHFARIFGSRELISNKINGTYLIPIFSGDTSSGHCSLCVVHKLRQRNMKAWRLDSLGTGKRRMPLHTK